MKRVLLVEDDGNLSASLADYLRGECYHVTAVESLASARRALGEEPHIVILDWMLPDGQGLDFLKEIRGQGQSLPIILLTAKNDLVDKILGLESGADDYLTKPFEPRELLTRMRVRMRGPAVPKMNTAKLYFFGLSLDQETRIAKFQGTALDLTKLEFDLLKLFMENPGRVFTRESLLNKVWGFEHFPTTRTVDNHLVQLRQKTNSEMFETVRGVGYRLVSAPR